MAEPPRGLLPPILRPMLAILRGFVGFVGMHQVPLVLRSQLWTAADGGHRIGTGVAAPLPDLVIGHVFPPGPGGSVQPPHIEGTNGDPEITVSWITPAAYAADGVTQLYGFTTAQLNPAEAPGFEYWYTAQWPQGPRNYALGARGVQFEKSLHYVLHLVAIDASGRTPPF